MAEQGFTQVFRSFIQISQTNEGNNSSHSKQCTEEKGVCELGFEIMSRTRLSGWKEKSFLNSKENVTDPVVEARL